MSTSGPVTTWNPAALAARAVRGSTGDSQTTRPERGENAGGVREECVEQVAERAVADQAAPHRRIREDQVHVLRARRARVAFQELAALDAGSREVASGGREGPGIDIGADQALVRAESRALDELEPAADEGIPHHVFRAGPRDARQRGRDGGMGGARHVRDAVVEARIGIQPGDQEQLGAGGARPRCPGGVARVVDQGARVLADHRGDAPGQGAPVAAPGPREPEARDAPGPGGEERLRVRMDERARDAIGQVLDPGVERDDQREVERGARDQELLQASRVHELDAGGGHDAGTERGELVREQPGEPAPTPRCDAHGASQGAVEQDGVLRRAQHAALDEQPRAGRAACEIRVGDVEPVEGGERRGAADLAECVHHGALLRQRFPRERFDERRFDVGAAEPSECACGQSAAPGIFVRERREQARLQLLGVRFAGHALHDGEQSPADRRLRARELIECRAARCHADAGERPLHGSCLLVGERPDRPQDVADGVDRRRVAGILAALFELGTHGTSRPL